MVLVDAMACGCPGDRVRQGWRGRDRGARCRRRLFNEQSVHEIAAGTSESSRSAVRLRGDCEGRGAIRKGLVPAQIGRAHRPAACQQA